MTKPGTERPGDLLHSCWWGPEPGVAAPEASPWAAQAPRPSLRTPGSPHYCLRSRGPPAPGEPEDRSPHVLLPTPRLRSLRGDAGLKGTEVGGAPRSPVRGKTRAPGGGQSGECSAAGEGPPRGAGPGQDSPGRGRCTVWTAMPSEPPWTGTGKGRPAAQDVSASNPGRGLFPWSFTLRIYRKI